MTKYSNTVDGTSPIRTDLHHSHFHQEPASEKQLSAAHIKATTHLKATAKLGTILKQVGGGLSRHRP